MCKPSAEVMHMKSKTLFYTLVVSVIMSLLGTAVLRFGSNGPSATPRDTATPDQKLEALEKATAQSPEMHKFLRRERAAQKANQDAAEDLPR
jgi:hypothetical protein